MIQFDEHIFQMGWFNHQPVLVIMGSCFQLHHTCWQITDAKSYEISATNSGGKAAFSLAGGFQNVEFKALANQKFLGKCLVLSNPTDLFILYIYTWVSTYRIYLYTFFDIYIHLSADFSTV